ncbi:aspartate/glutamate racemase family protein [Mycolicibacterium hassiacum]|uniref:aspartate/glutamate racemase family protein n=1 Tax=Mycolicibacterium hassiacum TaxID=46351 RepID=UPI0023F645F6|nr:aspartate/glutamate racemase family protein [Mycolicibacterium hassiacum]
MNIRIIHPVVEGAVEDALPALPDFVCATTEWLDEGPSSIECRYDEAMCTPLVLERIRRAAAEGVDGVVVNCFMDPALRAAREMVSIPVAGPGESAMMLACLLGRMFSVVLPAASGEPIVEEQAAVYVGRQRLASVRSVEMPVAGMRDHERLLPTLVEQGRLAVEEDGADVVILGCTGMGGVSEGFRREFGSLGLGVPVIDPTTAAVSAIVAQVMSGVAHSERAYALPSWRKAVV